MGKLQDSVSSFPKQAPHNEQLDFDEQHILDQFASCASLRECLEALTESISFAHPRLKACILIANSNQTEIEECFSFDFPKSFGKSLKGEWISKSSKGTCGVAIHTGLPAFCLDTSNADEWADEWKRHLISHDVSACHSTPIISSGGTAIGSLFLCLNEARTIDKKEQHIAELSARLAAIIIEKDQMQRKLQEETIEIEEELTDARLLQKLSMELIQEEETPGLYQKLMDAAVVIMQSQYASMQVVCQGSDGHGKLKLLASSGFSPEAEEYWQWVYHDTESSCGAAYRAGKRIVIPNMAECEFMQGTATLPIYLDGGILAAQSTPLYSRNGKLLGMISTHWDHPHSPGERDLSLLDILSRQAADLIERKQTMDALRQSEERLRALTTATSEVIYRMSADWGEMYHLDGRDFLSDTGKPISDWMQKCIIPEERGILSLAITEAIRTKKTFQHEYKVVQADGSTGWTFSRAIPILDKQGNIVEWFGAASDISARKQYESELETRVEYRTRELQRSNDDLQQFAHVASHDLKEPVRKIKTFSFRLQDALSDATNPNVKLYVSKILSSAERMSLMIEGVLKYATVNASEMNIGMVDLFKTIADIQSDLEILIQQKNATFNISDLPCIDGTQILIYQLFYNLVNNSLKFIKESVNPVIIISGTTISLQGIEYARIQISDNGIGFDPGQSRIIFDTFTRLHSRDEFDGTGLGLSLCRKIVEIHNGTIEAHGEKNVGATFTVMLPVRPDDRSTTLI
jgi:signal transduction histidine kinase/GAF domain-containing protein